MLEPPVPGLELPALEPPAVVDVVEVEELVLVAALVTADAPAIIRFGRHPVRDIITAATIVRTKALGTMRAKVISCR